MLGASPTDSTKESNSLRYVDTHCHLDDTAFEHDLESVLERASQQGVRSWINVGYEPARWTSTIELSRRFAGMAFTLGMHPQSAGQWNDDTAGELERLLAGTRPCAIGEIGIDLFRSNHGLEGQLTAFDAQLDLALQYALPVVIHMRSAEPEVLSALGKRRQHPPLLFHSFDGSDALTEFILSTDSLIGVGGLATRGKSVTIQQQLQNIPLEQMVLETDSPYLVPARQKESRNTPASIPVIATFLSGLTGLSRETIADQTTINAERFFGRLSEA